MLVGRGRITDDRTISRTKKKKEDLSIMKGLEKELMAKLLGKNSNTQHRQYCFALPGDITSVYPSVTLFIDAFMQKDVSYYFLFSFISLKSYLDYQSRLRFQFPEKPV